MEFEIRSKLMGKDINLKPVTTRDAEIIVALRNDELLGKHLSKTSGSVADQKKWIETYLERFDNGKEYYFIIEEHDKAVGTIRIYDIRDNSFCWGSWIVHPSARKTTAIQSALVLYDFAFFHLNFSKSHFDVRKRNERVVDFHKRMGASITGESDIDIFFEYSRANYETTRLKYLRFLPRSG